MKMNIQTLRLVVLGIFIAVNLGVGYWATRKKKEVGDWLVSGRNLGLWVMSFTVVATTASGFALVGMPGLTYAFGWAPLLWINMSIIALPLTLIFLGKPMRVLSERTTSHTIPEILISVYKQKAIHIIASVIIFVVFCAFLVVQWSAAATIVEGLFNIPYVTGLTIIAVVTALYSIGGGVMAASYTDFVQMCVMLFGALSVFFIGLSATGGLTGLNIILHEINPALVAPFYPPAFSIWTAISFL